MKKTILILLLLILIPETILASYNDCPNNKTDSSCAYPGECKGYTDNDNNKICDHSQLALILENRNNTILKTETKKETSNPTTKKSYHLVPIALILSLIYFITRLLLKRKIISVLTHKRIWNIFLLITFLASGILGVLLIIKINFGLKSSTLFNVLFWHVEIGIAMFTISIFHIIERWYFFKNIFKKTQ
jgi:hypothetical protein